MCCRCAIESDRTVFAVAELKSSPVLPDLGSANFFDFVKQLQSFAREEIIKRLKPVQEEYKVHNASFLLANAAHMITFGG
jgi:hypothetical protein